MSNFVRIYLLFIFTTKAFSVAAQTEYLVSVNSTNTAISKIDSLSGVKFLQSYSAYNQSTKELTVIGTSIIGQSPSYLYTINSITGSIIFRPILTNPNKIISFQYSRSNNILYGIVYENNGYYFVTINKISGLFTVINSIPNISGVGSFTVDEENQRMYLRAVDNNPNFGIWTIDLSTGNIISHVSTLGVFNIYYNNVTHKIYGLISRVGLTPGSYIWSICTINPLNGIISNIADLPNTTAIFAGDHGTLNEIDNLYLFTGVEVSSTVFLYSVDINSGNVISKSPIPSSGVAENDNLVFFRYDNISRKLYALLWEAHTIKTIPQPVDLSCKLNIQTKVSPNPVRNTLSINKNPTICKVTLALYNSLGQLVLNNKIINDGLNEVALDNLFSGIYYYELASEHRILLSGEIIKQ
ncbi:MAG: T9SS type A sorting domain-containing protein [Ferruginibacter sp.]